MSRRVFAGAGMALACLADGRGAVASTGAEFLRFNPSARTIGMGETMAAAGSGPSALSGNPAGLLSGPGSIIGLGHGTEIGGQRQEAVSFVTGGKHSAAGGQILLSTMSFEAVDGAGSAVAVAAQDLIASVAVARRFGTLLRAGMTGRLWTSALLDRRATGYSVDAGIRSVWESMYSAGVVIQNIGSGESFGTRSAGLPRRLRTGLAVRQEIGAVGVAVTGVWFAPMGGGETAGVHAGIEAAWRRFALRAGYAGTHDPGSWSAGGSVGAGPFDLHYAIAARDFFGPVHHLSAEWHWGRATTAR